jgi:hypothetical protein
MSSPSCHLIPRPSPKPIYTPCPMGYRLAPCWHIHRMSDVLSGVIGAGLHLETFTEYPHSNWEALFDVYARSSLQVPMCYTLTAVKG